MTDGVNNVNRLFGMRSIRWVLGLGVALAVSGCGQFQYSANRPVAEAPRGVDPIAISMAESAVRASEALDRLSQVETARTPVPDPGPLDESNVPAGLDTYVSVSWIGPVAPLAAKLADAAGYRFRVVGRPPAVPVVVDVTYDSAMVLEVLRDIGHQTGARADVAVDAQNRVVEVRYAP
jgi:defect-in-organelle-trafficking protein DotD